MVKIDFERERQWWDAKAPQEEEDTADEAINRALRWRLLDRSLEGVKTILDVGGGTGAFSIPLAQRGYQVTHLDLSPAMLDQARQKASGTANITFMEGNATDLSRFPDASFDLVLNQDGAISFCGSEAGKALAETCRAAARRVIVSVSCQAGLVPIWISTSIQELGLIGPSAYEMFDNGSYHQLQYPENPILARGMTQDYMGAMKAFRPHELRQGMEACGMQVIFCQTVGSLARFCPPGVLQKITQDEALMAEFIELCERYDEQMMPVGPGTRARAGLVAVGVREEAK